MTLLEGGISASLPQFPWDRLSPYKSIAMRHPGGIIDLSVGAPADPVPETVRQALVQAAGQSSLDGVERAFGEAAAGWLLRRHEVRVDPDLVVPTLGSKELLAWLPRLLGARPGDRVVHPELAYPTYAVGALLAGAEPVADDWPDRSDDECVTLAWINSPSNPTGGVLPPERIAEIVCWARGRSVVLASDECYIDLGSGDGPYSVLHPEICGGDHRGLLAVHSLSKRSNMAGYRAGFVTGDGEILSELRDFRRHLGLLPPRPVLAAMAAALLDDEHVDVQRQRYLRRRSILSSALARAGWRIAPAQGGLYLWAAQPSRDGWESVEALAGIGILVAPGEFYGASGKRHVRIALTAADERIAEAADRLAGGR
ncbi:succinyldiaminopimelate transaminase [Nonomuraea sp. NPDC050783]|uniref:succinyldiaminopimelate transaminase n=1 Tax=Nonomuraea sp. NPDC050783 TaxID=3154634 RepID=UPI0034674893